jgi:peptidoglycan/LPS O-acetylase OafA/YrhL
MIATFTTISQRIDVINGLRGLAILMVIYFHSVFPTLYQLTGFDWIIRHGWMGVNLFFILSGFVLYKPYYTGERSFNSRKDIWLFYRHRFFRLYPLFTFNLLVCLLLMGPVTGERLVAFLITLFGLSGFSILHLLPPLNPVLWSLSVEIWFSLFFPFIIRAINKYSFQVVFVTVLVIALLTRVAGMFYLYPNTNISLLRDGLPGRIDDFLVGMLTLRLYYQENYFNNLSGKKVWWIACVSICLLLTGFIGWDFTVQDLYSWYTLPLLNNFIHFGFMGLVVLTLKENTLLSKIFQSWALQVTGMMCFSLYIWHYLLIPSIQLPLPFVINCLVYLLFTYILSAFTYRYIEFGHVKEYKKLFLLPIRHL